jgi:alginate O-acetyltransferase complex protein AlgI
MLFNSIPYLWFLPTVFFLYWGVFKSIRARNILLIVVSYVFYAWWDPRFLVLLFASSFSDFWLGRWIDRASDDRSRKGLLITSLVFNLGLLGYFKYAGFFISTMADALHGLGFDPDLPALQVILPVGISFYTFQSISYTIEIYRRQMRPVDDPWAYLAFVSFFPHMVAGPIMRAIDLLPQITAQRVFTYANGAAGLRLILYGLFKKVVIADRLAPLVNAIFRDHRGMHGSDLALGALYFAFQIYGDFSGYSDIAIGSAKLLGIELMTNFRTPYLARDIADFWQRWHISLSSWFREHLYIPLGGNRAGKARRMFNVLLTFIISGFWHGANWTFLAWGTIHGLLYLPLVGRKYRDRPNAMGILRTGSGMFATFVCVTLAWVFFRAPSISDALSYLHGMLSPSLFTAPSLWEGLPFVLVMFVLDVVNRHHVRDPFSQLPSRALRYTIYFSMVLTVVLLSQREHIGFIYFQF